MNLTAKKDFGYIIEAVNLNAILYDDKITVVEYIEKFKPARFPRFYYLCYQIKMNGFIYNPLPLHKVDNTLCYIGGMLRLNACVELGYDSIDTIILDKKEDLMKLIKQQQKTTHKYFPEHILEPTER